MNMSAVVIQGTVRADGTLELEGKVPLPAGKVQVTLQPLPAKRKPRKPGSAKGKLLILHEDEEHLKDFEEYMR